MGKFNTFFGCFLPNSFAFQKKFPVQSIWIKLKKNTCAICFTFYVGLIFFLFVWVGMFFFSYWGINSSIFLIQSSSCKQMHRGFIFHFVLLFIVHIAKQKTFFFFFCFVICFHHHAPRHIFHIIDCKCRIKHLALTCWFVLFLGQT